MLCGDSGCANLSFLFILPFIFFFIEWFVIYKILGFRTIGQYFTSFWVKVVLGFIFAVLLSVVTFTHTWSLTIGMLKLIRLYSL